MQRLDPSASLEKPHLSEREQNQHEARGQEGVRVLAAGDPGDESERREKCRDDEEQIHAAVHLPGRAAGELFLPDPGAIKGGYAEISPCSSGMELLSCNCASGVDDRAISGERRQFLIRLHERNRFIFIRLCPTIRNSTRAARRNDREHPEDANRSSHPWAQNHASTDPFRRRLRP